MHDTQDRHRSAVRGKGLRITEQRRIIARVLSEAEDHPDVEALHERAAAIDSGISIATVYRTVRLFEEAGILERHDFGDGRARYEAATPRITTI
jgi:Fur family ferric uptake transcriptional regulator